MTVTTMKLSTGLYGLASGANAVGWVIWAKNTRNPKLANMAGMTFATIGAGLISTTSLFASLIAEPAMSPSIVAVAQAVTSAASGAAIALAANTIGTLGQSPTATAMEKMATTAACIASIALITLETAETTGIVGIIPGICMTLGIGMAAVEAARKAENYILREGLAGSKKALLAGAAAATLVGLEAALVVGYHKIVIPN